MIELDEGRYVDVDGGEDDNPEGEPENESDEESAPERNEEDGDDRDNDDLDGVYEDEEEEDNVNKVECANNEFQVQGKVNIPLMTIYFFPFFCLSLF